MANIEIHGSRSINNFGTLLIRLSKKFREAGIEEAVIDELHSSPNYCDEISTPAPFLRIWSDSEGEVEEVLEILEEFGMTRLFDIEITPLLRKFIPKKKITIRAISPRNDTKATPGMFRLTVWLESEMYQIGKDVSSRELAITLLSGVAGGIAYAIYNDKGEKVA